MSNVIKIDNKNDLDLLLQQFKQKELFVEMMEKIGDEANKVQDCLLEIRDNFWLSTAEGVQLDVIGNIQGQPREGRTDADYRSVITVRIVVNNGSGDEETIFTALTGIYGATIVQMNNAGDASLRIWVDVLLTSDNYKEIEQIIPAGVELTLVSGSLTYPFGFSTDPDALGYNYLVKTPLQNLQIDFGAGLQNLQVNFGAGLQNLQVQDESYDSADEGGKYSFLII